jgi:hypothetical protein
MQSKSPSQKDWLAHVARWRAGQLTRTAYCAQHDLKLTSLIYWIKQSKISTTPVSAPVRLIPVKIKVIPPKVEENLVLHCRNGSVLHLPLSTPATWLASLLGQLT